MNENIEIKIDVDGIKLNATVPVKNIDFIIYILNDIDSVYNTPDNPLNEKYIQSDVDLNDVEMDITDKTKNAVKAPNHTSLFLNWLEDKEKFNIKEFSDTYPDIGRDQIEKIISHQIILGKLSQRPKGIFVVVK